MLNEDVYLFGFAMPVPAVAFITVVVFIFALSSGLAYISSKQGIKKQPNKSLRLDAPPDCILTVRAKTPKFYGLQGIEEKKIELFCFDGFTYPEGYDAHEQARLFWKDHKKTYPKGSVLTIDLYYLGVYAYSRKCGVC